MDAETAKLVLYAVTAAAAVVWLAGLQFLLASARCSRPRRDVRFDAAEPTTDAIIQGTAEVEGEPQSLAAQAALMLAKGGVGAVGPQRIVQRTADAVVFESDPGSPGLARYVRRGALRFGRLSPGRTRIDYSLEMPRRGVLLYLGAVFQILGLVAIVAGFWLISTWVVSNPNPAVRGQAVQMVQVIHFLWPPFLFGGLYRRQYSVLRSIFHTLVHNMPYYQA